MPLRSFNDNRFIFEEVETVADGLGPTFNAQACRECHQNIVTGGASQIAEHRTGRLELLQFVESVGGSLIQSRSTHPDIFENVPFEDSISTFRISTNTAGRRVHRGHPQRHAARHSQCAARGDPGQGAGSGGARGQQCAAHRPIRVEESARQPGIVRGGRLSERDGNHHAAAARGEHLARARRSDSASPFDPVAGSRRRRYRRGCLREFHARDQGAAARGDKCAGHARAMPCSGRSDAVAVTHPRSGRPRPVRASMVAHCACATRWATRSSIRTAISCCMTSARVTASRCCRVRNSRPPRRRFAPCRSGRLRTRNRLMHDGLSFTMQEAISRHAGQATAAKNAYNALSQAQKDQVLAFLGSL